MTQSDTDTGSLTEVSEDQQLEYDGGYGSDALDGGDDTDDLIEVFAYPGDLIEEELA